MSKNTVTGSQANNMGLKTPVINEKSKQQKYAMTPEMNNKTYAERQGFG